MNYYTVTKMLVFDVEADTPADAIEQAESEMLHRDIARIDWEVTNENGEDVTPS